MLAQLIRSSDAAEDGTLSTAEGELVLLCLKPLLLELAEHRRQSAAAMELMSDALPPNANLANVVLLRGDA